MKTYAIAVSIALLACTPGIAQPATFNFAAQIYQIYRSDDSFSPGIAINPGSIIKGAFTFAPDDSGSEENGGIGGSTQVYHQPFSSQLELDGVKLKTPSERPGLDLTSRNNVTYDVDCAANVFCDTGPFDELQVTGSLGSSGTPLSILPEQSSWWIELRGAPIPVQNPDGTYRLETPYLDDAVIPGHIGTWNALDRRRELTVNLRFATGQNILMYAKLGYFSVPAGQPGDFNLDGAVDASDYVAFRNSNLTENEYNFWRSHFGENLLSSGAAEAGTVPEPCPAMLILATVVLLPMLSPERRLR